MKEYYCPSNCPDRSVMPNCHMTCERYLQYQKEMDALKEAKRKEFLRNQAIEKPYLAKSNIKKKAR